MYARSAGTTPKTQRSRLLKPGSPVRNAEPALQIHGETGARYAVRYVQTLILLWCIGIESAHTHRNINIILRSTTMYGNYNPTNRNGRR